MSAQIDIDSECRPHEVVSLGGFSLVRTTATDLEQHLQLALANRDQTALFFANTNFIVKCQPLRAEMMKTNTVIVNDGIGVDIASLLIHRNRFPANLNGTDFIPAYLSSVRDQAKVYLFGGKPGIAIRAADTLEKQFGVNVVGVADGYEQAQNAAQVVEDINATGANVLLVAMGNPAQEQWILNHRAQLNASVLFGVGALLDFLAGDKPRAPKVIQKLRLEWFYRLCLEPARLMRRYTIDIAVFLALCIKAGKGEDQTEDSC